MSLSASAKQHYSVPCWSIIQQVVSDNFVIDSSSLLTKPFKVSKVKAYLFIVPKKTLLELLKDNNRKKTHLLQSVKNCCC